MSEPLLPYGRQSIGEEEIRAVTEVLRSDWITQGPVVPRFERGVAEFCGSRHAVAVSSGTAALHAACLAAGFGPGDEVIVPPLTFAATATAVLLAGATPVFADVREADGLIDPEAALRRIGPRTRGLAGVDYSGHPCEWNVLADIARRHDLVTIDDACHALGAEYLGRRIGREADFTVLSFHPVKHVTTGEGGMVLVEDDDRARELARIRNHGIERERFEFPDEAKGPWYYEVQRPGLNYRITDIQCALGLAQMARLEGFLERRRELVRLYRERLSDLPEVRLPVEATGARSAWHLFVIRVPAARRSDVFQSLRASGIGVQVHYVPVHLHPHYRRLLGTRRGDCPVAEAFYDAAISLPLFPAMTDRDVDRVDRALRNALAGRPIPAPSDAPKGDAYRPDTGRMMALLRRLHPLHRTLVSDDMSETLRIVGESLGAPERYRVHRFPSGSKVWTWTVPKKFVVHEAYLEVTANGRTERICDFREHPLHLVSYSRPIERTLSFAEIAPHLHHSRERPDAIPWVFKYYDQDWGFCLPYRIFERLPRDGSYRAVVRTEFVDAALEVGEFDLPGTSDEYILFLADTCHPCQVNDSLTGVALLVDLARHFAARPPGRLGLKFLFLPETIGSIAYLANHEHVIPRLRYGIFAELFGHDHALRLQRTRQGDHFLDRVSRYVLRKRTGGNFVEGPFCHTIITNDEKVTNAPGVDIPTIAINRWPGFPAYHTSDDRPEAILPEKMAEVALVVEEIVEILQTSDYPRRTYRGPLFLSGLDLELDWRRDRALKRTILEILNHVEGDENVFDIAAASGADYRTVQTLVAALESKGLVERSSAPWPGTSNS